MASAKTPLVTWYCSSASTSYSQMVDDGLPSSVRAYASQRLSCDQLPRGWSPHGSFERTFVSPVSIVCRYNCAALSVKEIIFESGDHTGS